MEKPHGQETRGAQKSYEIFYQAFFSLIGKLVNQRRR